MMMCSSSLNICHIYIFLDSCSCCCCLIRHRSDPCPGRRTTPQPSPSYYYVLLSGDSGRNVCRGRGDGNDRLERHNNGGEGTQKNNHRVKK